MNIVIILEIVVETGGSYEVSFVFNMLKPCSRCLSLYSILDLSTGILGRCLACFSWGCVAYVATFV